MDSILIFLFILSPMHFLFSLSPGFLWPSYDLGDLAQGAAATHFSLKFCIIFIEFSQK